MARRIGVGLIGARADRGWASVAHVPAIRAVPALELRAVATTQDSTARAAASAFGVPLAFGDPLEMIRHDDIELVSVSVKAPGHRALVQAAIDAGKAVFCEWPLGISLAETEALADAARQAGVRTAIGLQGRSSPWVRQVRALVQGGYVGRIMSTTLLASDDFSTGRVAQANAYMLDPANGANALTIQAGHFIDTVCYAVGAVDRVAAQLATTRPDVVVAETGAVITATSPDQIVVAATLAGGGVGSFHIRAGRTQGDNLQWEIQGTDGFLRISSRGGYLHWRPLTVQGARGEETELSVLAPPPTDLFDHSIMAGDGPPQNVAYAYAELARDILEGSKVSPDFDQAVASHRLVDAIATSATTGQAQHASPSSTAASRP